MGKRGPAKEPSNVVELKRGRNKAPKRDTPSPEPATIEPPDWIRDPDDYALEVWNHLAPQLIRAGVLTSWDVYGLAVFCGAVADYRASRILIQTMGTLVESKHDGSLQRNPALISMRQATQTMMSFGTRFGLTPGDREDLATGNWRAHIGDTPDETDPADKYLTR